MKTTRTIPKFIAIIVLTLCILSFHSCKSIKNLVSNNDDIRLTAEEIYEKVSPSVVRISTDIGTGTGFFFDEKGTVITNYHVIDGCKEATIETVDEKEYDVLQVIGYSKEKDIAILSTTVNYSVPLRIRTSKIKTGEKIYTLGSSLGSFGWTLSDGLISSASRKTEACEYIQISAPISPGNSGGPLIDENGNAIGITTLSFTEGQNVNFAVSASEISSINTSNPKSLMELFADNIEEKPEASSMYVKDYKTQFNEDEDRYIFFFTLTDENETVLSGSGKLEIRIVNDDGTTVYNKTKTFSENDFGKWSNSYEEYYCAAIYINESEITKASKSEGTLYFKLYVGDLVWDELSCEINQLPYNQTVEYLKEERIQYDKANEELIFMFQLTDSYKVAIDDSGSIAIRIVNNDGITVYNKNISFTKNDFSIWTDKYENQYYLCSVKIKLKDILGGSTTKGTFYYKISVSNGSFKEFSIETTNLPLKNTTINYPSLPTVLSELDYYGEIETQVSISSITHENSYLDGTSINIYVSGEKTFDESGNDNDATCWFKWKLYDADGYMIQSGTVITDSLRVGEKFKEKIWVYDIVPGNTYTLKLFNYD